MTSIDPTSVFIGYLIGVGSYSLILLYIAWLFKDGPFRQHQNDDEPGRWEQ